MARTHKPKPTTPEDEDLILRLYGCAHNLSTRDIRIATDFSGGEIARVLNKYRFPRRNNRLSDIARLQVKINVARRARVIATL